MEAFYRHYNAFRAFVNDEETIEETVQKAQQHLASFLFLLRRFANHRLSQRLIEHLPSLRSTLESSSSSPPPSFFVQHKEAIRRYCFYITQPHVRRIKRSKLKRFLLQRKKHDASHE